MVHRKRRRRRRRRALKGVFKSAEAANRRRYSSIRQGKAITRIVPRACAIVQSGGKKGKLRKGCKISKSGHARCDLVTALPRTARWLGKKKKIGGKRTVRCPR